MNRFKLYNIPYYQINNGKRTWVELIFEILLSSKTNIKSDDLRLGTLTRTV